MLLVKRVYRSRQRSALEQQNIEQQKGWAAERMGGLHEGGTFRDMLDEEVVVCRYDP